MCKSFGQVLGDIGFSHAVSKFDFVKIIHICAGNFRDAISMQDCHRVHTTAVFANHDIVIGFPVFRDQARSPNYHRRPR